MQLKSINPALVAMAAAPVVVPTLVCNMVIIGAIAVV